MKNVNRSRHGLLYMILGQDKIMSYNTVSLAGYNISE